MEKMLLRNMLLIFFSLHNTFTGVHAIGESSSYTSNDTSCLFNGQCPLLQTCCHGSRQCCPAEYHCCIGINWCCPAGYECTMGDAKCVDHSGIRIPPLIGGIIGLVAMAIILGFIIKFCPNYKPPHKQKLDKTSFKLDDSGLSTQM